MRGTVRVVGNGGKHGYEIVLLKVSHSTGLSLDSWLIWTTHPPEITSFTVSLGANFIVSRHNINIWTEAPGMSAWTEQET